MITLELFKERLGTDPADVAVLAFHLEQMPTDRGHFNGSSASRAIPAEPWKPAHGWNEPVNWNPKVLVEGELSESATRYIAKLQKEIDEMHAQRVGVDQ